MSKGKRTALLYFLLLGYVSLLAVYNVTAESVSYADCPACFKGENRMAAHPGASGARPFYSVYVDTATVTDPRVSGSALTGAMNAWNSATGSNGTTTPIALTNWSGDSSQMPQIVLKIGATGTTKKGEKICAKMTTSSDSNGNILSYAITLPPESANWSEQRIREVLEHELGHVLGVDDVNQGCDSIMQQGGADCTTSVHGTIEARDVNAARKYVDDQADCDKKRKKDSNEIAPGDFGDGGGGDTGGGDTGGGDDDCEWVTTCTQFCYYEDHCTVYDECGDCYWYESWYNCDPPDCTTDCVY